MKNRLQRICQSFLCFHWQSCWFETLILHNFFLDLGLGLSLSIVTKILTECVLKIFHICIRFSSLSVISKYQNKKLAYHFHHKGWNCLNFSKFAYRISLYLPPIIRVDNKDWDSLVCSVITRPALIGPDLLCSSRGSGGIVKSANCFDNLSWDCVLCPHNLSPLSDINSALESQLM